MSLLSDQSRVGDEICILHGGSVPYVLCAVGDKYRLVG
jgi:hypothetical protein